MAMNGLELRQGSFRRQAGVGHLQSRAHDAIQDQCHKANHRVCADALRQAVIHRRNLNLGFQDFEATLDISQAFVTCNNFLGCQVRDVGDQQQFAV